MGIKLNLGLDPRKLSAEFATKKRLQLRDFLTEESARAVYADLQNLDWWLAFRDRGAVIELSPEQLRSLSAEQAAAIRQTVDKEARQGFQFLYNYFPLFKRYFEEGGQDRAVFRLYEFLNSSPMIDFFRKLTGLDDIAWADGQATLYRATHFLKFHTDDVPTEERRAAYVLNLTPDWDLDWGGLLQFWSDENDVEHAYRPIFNALNIFTVPSRHSVSAVASYAPGLRFSITGWLRAGNPPGPIG